ncbi:required for excision 1-B domain-containing protein-like, partial [Antedon mediterranea]|uniref:required for excision 1-B domain-containing protein-like n=1 Tax=Antedon mediterranea TaxID=105859 RepID=UPI003AF4F849
INLWKNLKSEQNDPEPTDSEPKQLLHEFYTLQEQRVTAFKMLDNAHTAYLSTAPDYDFQSYKQKVHSITEDFNRISQRIILIEKLFRDKHEKIAVADCLTQVQTMEKQHLELIAELQLAKQNMQDIPNDENVRELMIFIKQRLNKLLEEIAEHLENLKYETEDLLDQD